MFTVLKTVIEIVGPVALYLTVRMSGSMLSDPGLFFFPALAFVLFTCVVTGVYALADAYETSVAFLRDLERIIDTRSQRTILKESLSPLRNRAGSLYFVDRQLTLNEIRFMADASILLLLNY